MIKNIFLASLKVVQYAVERSVTDRQKTRMKTTPVQCNHIVMLNFVSLKFM